MAWLQGGGFGFELAMGLWIGSIAVIADAAHSFSTVGGVVIALVGARLASWVMFLGSWELSHVRFSQSRVFMVLAMGGTMGLVMLGWMLNMYKSKTANLSIVAASILLLAAGTVLDRSQITVHDISFSRAMIPHHSLAITRSERADLSDVRVCELAVEISEAQRREIAEMEWLIDDLQKNGVAATPEEAAARPVPQYEEPAVRRCPAN